MLVLHLCDVSKQNSFGWHSLYYAACYNAYQSLTVTNTNTDAFRPVHRRTEMLLRALVVVLSLVLMYDDPGQEEWEDVAAINMQDREELWRNGAQPDHKMAPVIQEVTHRPYRLDAGRDDASVFVLEGGILKEDQRLVKNSHVVHTPMGEDTQVDVSLSPNQSGKTASSQHQKHDVFSSEAQSPPSQLHISTSGKRPEHPVADYFWWILNAFSLFSMIHLLRKCLGRPLQNKSQTQSELEMYPATEVTLPDSNTLLQFHSRCIRALSDNRSWEIAFLEGFANDLLDVMRSFCDESGSTVIEDFQMANVRNIIVTFTPPEPYRFQCFLRKDPIDMQMCGQIKVVRTQSQSQPCPCQSFDADDLVCLLHCDTERSVKPDVCGLLCLKDSLLSKSQVTKWFQSTVKQAWGIISHKYEFELNIGYIDTPGALQVRFRSGKKVSFTMNPVVKFNSEAYFLTSHTPSSSDNIWTLSLGGYEDRFFKEMTRYLPVNSCVNQTLEIALFLHRRQAVLTGGSELKDSHFRMALMHLLLIREPPQWEPKHLAHRLQDLLDFVKKSLEKKTLHHVLIGNPLIRKVTKVPAELTQADPVNLFHPLLMHNCLHRNAVKHFQEILRNAHILIDDYLCSGPEAQ